MIGYECIVAQLTKTIQSSSREPAFREFAQRFADRTPDDILVSVHAINARVRAMDADDEAIVFASICEATGRQTKLRIVPAGAGIFTVAVDVQAGDTWVSFTMGQRRV